MAAAGVSHGGEATSTARQSASAASARHVMASFIRVEMLAPYQSGMLRRRNCPIASQAPSW